MVRRRRSILALCLLSSCVPASAALGSETIIYTYDDRGRLIRVDRGGTVNDGIQASYGYDLADNRTNVTVSGPGVSINDTAASEGATLNFTVTRTSTTSAMSVNYATSNGTAAAGSDYAATSGTLNFAVGEASKPINVPTIDDPASEGAETVNVTLSDPIGAALIDGTGVGTINDNDAPPACGGVSFTIASNGAVTEGANSRFTVAKSGTATGSCSVNYATTDGSAVAASDYTATSGSLTFTTTQTSQTIDVPTTDDTAIESAETLSVGLSSPTGGSAIGSPGIATATINDGDSGPCAGVSFSVNDPTGNEGQLIVFTVSKTGATSGTCTVNYGTVDGTGRTPGDYIAKSGTLSFGPSITSLTVSVQSVDNWVIKPNKYFYLDLSVPGGGSAISDPRGQATVIESGNENCTTCLAASPLEEGE